MKRIVSLITVLAASAALSACLFGKKEEAPAEMPAPPAAEAPAAMPADPATAPTEGAPAEAAPTSAAPTEQAPTGH